MFARPGVCRAICPPKQSLTSVRGRPGAISKHRELWGWSSSQKQSSHAETHESSSLSEPEKQAPSQACTKPLTKEQHQFLDSALRVNHAGELAATLIYAFQIPPITRSHPHLRPLMQHMYDQESGHFSTFIRLLAKHRVRPTAMYQVWQAAASVLGWSTGLMGREAAMACTEAVETEIGEHYNSQVKVLLQWVTELEKRGEAVDPDIKDLTEEIRRIRDEELEHLDHAVEHDAKQARPYEVLNGIIRAGCRGAIRISERI